MSTSLGVAGLVLHFRTPDHTLTCVQSLVSEGVRRIVLVDNSEDQGVSLRMMDAGLAELRRAGVQLDLLEPGHNLGFGAGVAEGLRALAYGAAMHVLLINSDATLVPDSLPSMVRMLETHSVVVPLHSAHDTLAGSSSFKRYRPLFALLYPCPPHRGHTTIPSGCCVLIRADQRRMDFFDRDFFFYGEDIMLGFDLAQRGLGVAECSAATVVHAGSASARNGSLFYEYHMARAHWLLARKLARNRVEFAAFIAMRCLTLSLRASLRSARGRSLLPWRGLLLATRDVLQGRRRSLTPAAAASPERA